jgi:DUF4097 and DUF4098 domain-containing protein YvlB
MLRSTLILLTLTGLSACFVQLHQDDGITELVEPFDSVVVTVDTGAVEIRGDDTVMPEVDWDMRWGMGCPEVDFRVHEGVLYVEGSCPAGSWSCSTDFVLTVPTGVDVDVHLTTGRIEIEAVGAVRAELTTGDIDLRGARDEVALKATTGRIHATDLAVREAWAEVTTGSIDLRLDEPFASLDAEVVTGDVTLEVPGGCYDLDLDVVTGDIDTAGVDCGCDQDSSIHARAVTGSITVLGR